MKLSLIYGHAGGAATASGVWCAGLSLAPGSPDWRLIAAGILAPAAVAALNLALIHRAEQLAAGQRAMDGRKASPTAPVRRALPGAEVAR